MKKRFILLIFLVLFISSCANLNFGSFGNFFGGTSESLGGRGLILRFLEPTSREIRIPEGELGAFIVRLQLENYVVNDFGINGELCLRDTLTDNFGGIKEGQCQGINLESATRTPREGLNPTISKAYQFGPYSYMKSRREFTSLSETQIIADVKYEVEAKAHSTICIQRSITQKICSEEQNLKIEQPDLPLKVSSINARTFGLGESGTNALLEITFSKTSKGQLVSPGNILTSSLPGSALVGVEILINNAPAKCSGFIENNVVEITQDKNQKVIKCSTKVLLDQDYIDAAVEIKMSYGFIQSVDGPIVKFAKEEDLV